MLIEAPALKMSRAASWRYPDGDETRDLRIDFIRGMVMLILIVVHIERFSFYNFVVWERVGVVSGGEGFVILAGFVTGLISRRRIEMYGWKYSSRKLLHRAAQLWLINVVAICAVAALSLLPWLNISSLTTFTDRGTHQVWKLLPPPGSSADTWMQSILLLRIGPHQIQILGLYVCLLAISPLLLMVIAARRTTLLLLASWLIYGFNTLLHLNLTRSQFENAFPLLTWQILFVHGLAVGYHRERVWRYMATENGRRLLFVAGLLFAGFLLWAQNTPNPLIPSYARISIVPAGAYRTIYDGFMQKNTLGVLRLLDYACVLMVTYAALTHFWEPIRRAAGWFFIPIGQATLYVFIVHLAVVAVVDNILPFGFAPEQYTLWVNTLAHTAALGGLLLLVRCRVMFRWIPR